MQTTAPGDTAMPPLILLLLPLLLLLSNEAEAPQASLAAHLCMLAKLPCACAHTAYVSPDGSTAGAMRCRL